MTGYCKDCGNQICVCDDIQKQVDDLSDQLSRNHAALVGRVEPGGRDEERLREQLLRARYKRERKEEAATKGRIARLEAEVKRLKAEFAEEASVERIALRERNKELEAENARLREALETLPSKITIEPWEDREMIVCYQGEPVGMTITERDGRGITEFFRGRGVWGDIAGRIIRAAQAVKEGE